MQAVYIVHAVQLNQQCTVMSRWYVVVVCILLFIKKVVSSPRMQHVFSLWNPFLFYVLLY